MLASHGACVQPGLERADSYRPRNPEQSVLYRVVAAHLETFLARQQQRGRCVPQFVEKCGAPHFSTNVKLSVMWS